MDISELYSIFCKHPVVTTDTRDCPRGAMFFALKGATFDGNAFAASALEKGCAYAVVDDEKVVKNGDERYVLVENVLDTLQQLARYHRQKLGTTVIQVTGTNGKTTTKELMAAVLSEKYSVLYTLGNFNNHIGVPKTLLRLKPEHEIAVIETGASHPGEIKMLSNIADPDCGLITNVGKAHLAGFGSFEGVIKTKGELYDYLRNKKGGFIFRDGNNKHLAKISQGLKSVTYGLLNNGFDVEGKVVECNPYLKITWRPKDGEWETVQTRLIGAYNLQNVLAAAAVGVRFGVETKQISKALRNYEPTNNRSEFKKTENNELIIDA